MEGFKQFVYSYSKGDIIFTEGDEQNHFYIINSGRVQLKLNRNNLILISLGKGDFFGEESLNDGQEAMFTVEVMEDASIIRIPYSALVEMMKKSREISLKIVKKLSEKNLKILEYLFQMKGQDITSDEQPASESLEEDNQDLLDPAIQAYLVIQRSNRVVQLTHKTTFLGRRDYTSGFTPDIDLTKEDEEKYISRKHAKIQFTNDRFYISEEPGAINGTFINGEKMKTGVKYELNNEDELTLCHLSCVFKA
ncbi:MAG TPA: cyclic nucleotide-binding domain-containing protein [Candidatus Aminicenantes bacterium]|nr:cyclic nucleotide-binding domain-containing protein [Candidatus Aminicenantes bacterium]